MKKVCKVLSVACIPVFLLALQSGCSAAPKGAAVPEAEAAAVEKAPANPVISGTVTETMNSGGYTYVNLKNGEQTGWVAIPETEMKVGDEVELLPGAEMGPFTSKTLDRTFEKIVFSPGPAMKATAAPTGQQAAMPTGHPAIPGMANGQGAEAPAAPESSPAKLLTAGTVVETMNSGGYTYVCLEKDGQKSWAAVPPAEVEVGDEVELRPGMAMGKFTSRTLKRTFDNILFSGGIASKK